MFGSTWICYVGTSSPLDIVHSPTNQYLVTGQLWSLSTTTIQCRLRLQMNTSLFAKTLIRKDVASSSNSSSKPASAVEGEESKEDEDDFSSSTCSSSYLLKKRGAWCAIIGIIAEAQIMTLMTTDVDRISEFAYHIFALVGTLFHFSTLLCAYCATS